MLTRISAQSLHQPKSYERLERSTAEQVERACPGLRWIANFAVLGPCDYVSALVRSYGHAHTEVWPALAWPEFKRIVHELPGPA